MKNRAASTTEFQCKTEFYEMTAPVCLVYVGATLCTCLRFLCTLKMLALNFLTIFKKESLNLYR